MKFKDLLFSRFVKWSFITLLFVCTLILPIDFANAQFPGGGSGTPVAGVNLSEQQLEAVFATLGSNFIFRPVEPPSAKADVFGISFGVIASTTSGKKLKDTFPTANIPDQIPSGNIYLGVHAPWGLAAEIGVIPSTASSSGKISNIGANLKWTLSKNLLTFLPFDIALRGSYTKPSLFVESGTSTLNYNSTITGGSLSIGKRFAFIEPYIGFGSMKQEGKLNGSGTAELFGTTIQLTLDQSKTHSTDLIFAGTQLHLGFFNISVEYSKLFGIDNGALKLAFDF